MTSRPYGALILAVVAGAFVLGGCQTTRPKKIALPPPAAAPPPAPPPPVVAPPVRPAPAPAPAPRSCVPRNLPPPPRYPDTDAALRNAPGAADRYQLLAAGRLLRQQRLEDLERVVQNCR